MKQRMRRIMAVLLMMLMTTAILEGQITAKAVEQKTVTSMIVALKSSKTISIGDTVSISDLDIVLNYSDGTKGTPAEGSVKFNGTDNSITITQEVTQVRVNYSAADGTAQAMLNVVVSANGFDHIEIADYTGGKLTIGNEVKKSYFKVVAYFADGTSRTLTEDEFTLTLANSSSQRITSTSDVVTISYTSGVKTDSRKYTVYAERAQDAAIETKKLLRIKAEYNGPRISVGGTVKRSDIEVTAYFRVTYEDGTRETVEEVIESGWTLGAYKIRQGSNDIEVIYSSGGITETDYINVQSADTIGQWVTEGTAWRYQLGNETYLVSDWVQSGGRWYYLDEYGYMVYDTSMLIGGKTYRFDAAGALVTGWVYQNRNWYYYSSGGTMETGWINVANKWYYLDNEGMMLTGWLFKDGKWYYLTSDGSMKTGWLKDGAWYFLDNTGAMKTGWVRVGGKYYFLDKGGAMLTNTWVGNYYVDGNGVWTQTR